MESREFLEVEMEQGMLFHWSENRVLLLGMVGVPFRTAMLEMGTRESLSYAQWRKVLSVSREVGDDEQAQESRKCYRLGDTTRTWKAGALRVT